MNATKAESRQLRVVLGNKPQDTEDDAEQQAAFGLTPADYKNT